MSALVFADHDDPDFALADRDATPARIFPLGLPADTYRLTRTGGEWTLHTPQYGISEQQIASASRVVIRRWRSSPPRPLVDVPQSGNRGDPTAHYIQRQWDSTVLGLLSLAHNARPHDWSRHPCRVDSKIVTHQALASLGILPDYVIAQDLDDLPPWPATVAKPVDGDQSCGADRRATALLVSPEDRRTPQPGPMITQRAIISRREVRAVYSFGHIGAVLHTRGADSARIDARLLVPQETAPFSSPVLTAVMERIARRLDLRVFTVDIKIDDDDRLWWLDVNPDGLIAPFDDTELTLRTALLAGLQN